MKLKKGFTIIELIICIALISIIGVGISVVTLNRKEIDVCLVLYWKNQYGYEYKQKISMSYEQYKSRNDMYVSTKETFEIEYIK